MFSTVVSTDVLKLAVFSQVITGVRNVHVRLERKTTLKLYSADAVQMMDGRNSLRLLTPLRCSSFR